MGQVVGIMYAAAPVIVEINITFAKLQSQSLLVCSSRSCTMR